MLPVEVLRNSKRGTRTTTETIHHSHPESVHKLGIKGINLVQLYATDLLAKKLVQTRPPPPTPPGSSPTI